MFAYDEGQWLQAATGHSAGLGAATAMGVLCVKLAERKLLGMGDVEELRLASLMFFEGIQGKESTSAESKLKLEGVRKSLDDLWHKAAVAAEFS